MKLAYIGRKLVNINNILYINCREEEDGRIFCLFVLAKDIVLEEVYANREMFRKSFIEYGLMREENLLDKISDAIERIFARLKRKFAKRKLRLVK